MYIYIYIHLEPKWDPLFCLEFRPSVGGFNPPKQRTNRSLSYIYLYRHPQNALPFHWIHPGGFGPLKTRSIPWETKRNERGWSRSKPHLDKDSERTLQVEGWKGTGMKSWSVKVLGCFPQFHVWALGRDELELGMLRSLFLGWWVNWGIC